MAINHAQQLREVTAALEAARIQYAMVGGHAVAAWVARADRALVPSTEDADILVRRDDLPDVRRVLEGLGLSPSHPQGPSVAFHRPSGSGVRSTVNLVFAGELVHPEDDLPAPLVDNVDPSFSGMKVVSLPSLVAMTLVANRPVDQAYLIDLLMAGVVPATASLGLPARLAQDLDRWRHVARSGAKQTLREQENAHSYLRVLAIGGVVVAQLAVFGVLLLLDLWFILKGHGPTRSTLTSAAGVAMGLAGVGAIVAVSNRARESTAWRVVGTVSQALVALYALCMLLEGRIGTGAGLLASSALALAAVHLAPPGFSQPVVAEVERRVDGTRSTS